MNFLSRAASHQLFIISICIHQKLLDRRHSRGIANNGSFGRSDYAGRTTFIFDQTPAGDSPFNFVILSIVFILFLLVRSGAAKGHIFPLIIFL